MQLMSTDRKGIHAVLQEMPKVQILFEMTRLEKSSINDRISKSHLLAQNG